MSAQLKI